MARSPTRSTRPGRARSRDAPHRSSGLSTSPARRTSRSRSHSRPRRPTSRSGRRSISRSPSRSQADADKENKKTRKRKRHAESDKQRKRASHLEEKAIDLGRKLGRMGDMWYSFRTIFEHALDRQATLEDIGYTEGEDALYAAFLAIIDQVPNIMKIIEEVPDEDWDFFCSKLDNGRGRARNEDTSTFIHKGSWYDNQIPADRRLAGFKHEFCARQLCPVTLDWTDPEVRAPLEDGKKLPSPSDSPGLLYANEQYNRDNPLLGYLKNQYLVFGARAILLGPTAARVRGASQAKKSGVAYSHSVKTINFPFIAYVACLHHFACSNQTTFSAGGTNTGWPYAEFYRSILGVIACMSDGEKEGLLKWWNQQVFGGIPHEMLAGSVPGKPSQMEQMKEFLNAKKAAHVLRASADPNAVGSA